MSPSNPAARHGRTPPCADALVNAGLARVVAAMQDPNPSVAGKGLLRLMSAGIDVHSGVLETEARALNKGFLKRMEHGLPYVRVKLAMSLDGRTAMASGESKWITGPAARSAVQRLRAESSVVLTGADTVLADGARLTVRPNELSLDDELTALALSRPPLRVLIDGQLRVPLDAPFFQAGPTLVATCAAAQARERYHEQGHGRRRWPTVTGRSICANCCMNWPPVASTTCWSKPGRDWPAPSLVWGWWTNIRFLSPANFSAPVHAPCLSCHWRR